MSILDILNIDVEDGILDELGGNEEREFIIGQIGILIHKFSITLESLRSASISRPDSISATQIKYQEFIDDLIPLMKKLDCEYVYRDVDMNKEIKIKFNFNDRLSYILKIDKKYKIKIYRKRK